MLKRERKTGTFRYNFVLRDHLGNTRVTFADKEDDALPLLYPPQYLPIFLRKMRL